MYSLLDSFVDHNMSLFSLIDGLGNADEFMEIRGLQYLLRY